MQIAKVVVKTRTGLREIFDYEIPPEILPSVKIGVLVEVFFHGRKLEAIVIDLKRSSKILKILPIISVIDPLPVVDEAHIKLARWISDYYFEPFSKTLFENIVPPAKRSIGKNPAKIIFFGKKRIEKQKILVLGNFRERLHFYQNKIKETLAGGQSVIILIPDLLFSKYFLKICPIDKKEVSIFHAGLTKTARWQEFDKIRRGQIRVVIGSQSALFSPLSNIGLIIVDQEENETYKNDQSPRFHSVKVAEKLAEIAGGSLILGSTTPRVETYYNAGKNHFLIKTFQSPNKITQSLIVDMNNERGAISYALEEKIEDALNNKKRVLFFLNRKGEGTKFSCSDCGWIAVCEKCGLPLIPQKTENICYHCQNKIVSFEKCPKCNSVQLKPMGLGTKKLQKILTKKFPKNNIIIIEKESGLKIPDSWDAAIVTSYALKFPLVDVYLSAIIDADQGLNLPDFNASEKSFQTILKFLKIAKFAIIQTHLPESFIAKSLSNQNYEAFFKTEILNRKKFFLPPFAKIILLSVRDKNQKKAEIVSLALYQKLIGIKFGGIYEISKPHPPFFKQKNNFYIYQIVIKIKPNAHLPQELSNLFKSFDKNCKINVDPISLL